jgi:uncharacterized membrane protein
MRSKFSIFGHPLHPTMVALPVGLFGWTFVADIVYLSTGKDHMWYDIAFWTGLVAAVTAFMAALPGFGDYFTMAIKSDARDMATAHMLLNLTVVALYVIAFLMMLDDNAVDGAALTIVVILHAVGLGLLGLSGWLGGEMVYKHHLAMVADTAEGEEAELQRHEMRPTFRERHLPR